MKYKLPRPKYSPTLLEAIKRELKKQKFHLPKLSNKSMKELEEMMKIIKSRGLPSYLVLKQLPDPMGWGIFLHPKSKPLPKGKLLAIYSGEALLYPMNVTDESAYAFAPVDDMTLIKEEQKILDKKNKHHPRRLYSLNIDAEKNGNYTRFINHSDKPNVEARLLSIPDNEMGIEPAPIEVVYFVKKKILPGQQLLVSYEDGEESYWGVLKLKPIPIFADSFVIDKNLNLIDQR